MVDSRGGTVTDTGAGAPTADKALAGASGTVADIGGMTMDSRGGTVADTVTGAAALATTVTAAHWEVLVMKEVQGGAAGNALAVYVVELSKTE